MPELPRSLVCVGGSEGNAVHGGQVSMCQQ